MTDSTPREPTPEPTPDQFRPEGVSNWYEDYPFGAVPPGPVPPGGGGAPGAVPGALPPGGAPGVRVRRRGHVRPTVAAVLAAGTLAASAAATHALWPSGGTRAATSSSTLPSGSASGPRSGAPASSTEGDGAPTDVSSIAAKVDPAVVDINATFGYQGARGAGTGIVLTSDGEILTNNHVIDGATSISVTDVGNGRTYTAKVVGYDATDDVAVLQLAGASGLETASIGDSSAVKVGQAVVAIGNAGGTGGTPTAAGGSVTALNQTITASDALDGTSESLSNLIETNANVQSGDSGGPLVDTAGRVIGMDTAASQGYSLQSAYGAARQGYAIPINQALSIARQIESGQASSTVHIGGTAFLGVLISSSSQSPGSFSYGGYGDYYGGSTEPGGGSGSASGAVVGGVVSGGPAAQAGLSRGDVITSLDGHAVTTSRSLSSMIAGDRPGQRVELSWTDTSGVSHTATVTLQSGPPA
ncbi:MAG TPA: trypsin-like peptidase domain-containing protein [Acidimicrobiales bacterium]|nr:trypsin-like peptidase domain-containing protein [Acidimicrobiales bacterium]